MKIDWIITRCRMLLTIMFKLSFENFSPGNRVFICFSAIPKKQEGLRLVLSDTF